LFAPDAPVEVTLSLEPEQLTLPTWTWRESPPSTTVRLDNDGTFPLYVTLNAIRVVDEDLDPVTVEAVEALIRVGDGTEIPVAAEDRVALAVDLVRDPTTWVHGTYTVALDFLVGGFDPAVDTGTGATALRRARYPEAWVETTRTLTVRLTLDCDLDLDGRWAVACDGVLTGDDCEDLDATIPDTEVCDGADNDCDGRIDADAADAPTWYADDDADRYGDQAVSTLACTPPTANAWVQTPGDCDDADATRFPGAVEVCDGEDDDCDGRVDNTDLDATTWYEDRDRDGWGDPARSFVACSAPGAGWVTQSGDCNDLAATVRPDATDDCAAIDLDCDGLGEENCAGAPTP
jgi:hypothetical protein